MCGRERERERENSELRERERELRTQRERERERLHPSPPLLIFITAFYGWRTFIQIGRPTTARPPSITFNTVNTDAKTHTTSP